MAAKEFHHGDQDSSDKQRTYSAFMELTKWACLHLAAIIVFLVLWFCTPAGFVTGAIAGIVLMAIGFLALKKKPGSATAH